MFRVRGQELSTYLSLSVQSPWTRTAYLLESVCSESAGRSSPMEEQLIMALWVWQGLAEGDDSTDLELLPLRLSVSSPAASNTTR